jgi:hypothetical protein
MEFGAVNPRLRYLFCLIALGASFGVGLLLFPAANDRPQVAGGGIDPTVRPTTRPILGPIMAQGSDIVPIETPATATSEPPAPENRPTAAPPREQVKSESSKAELLKPEPMEAQRFEPAKPAKTESPKVAVEKPAADRTPAAKSESQKSEPLKSEALRSEPPKPERRAPKRIVAERPAPPAANKVAEDSPARQKAARREAARRKTPSEALRTVRRFDDKLQDIPVSAYAADGARRNIVIRPTNIQDVYYYSVPR